MKKLISFLLFATILAPQISTAKVKATCPQETPLLDEKGYCHSCFATYEVKLMFSEDIAMCTNEDGSLIRENIRFGKTVLKNCPNEKPLKNDEGCFPCDFGGAIETTNCNVCDGINNPHKRSIINELCTLDDCTNRPLKDMNGGCYTCDDKNKISVAAGTCLKACPNREVNTSMSYGNIRIEECSLPFDINSKNCPQDKPILNHNLECLECNNQARIKALKGCDQCPNRIEKGHWATNDYSGNLCIIKPNNESNAPTSESISINNKKPNMLQTSRQPKPDMVFDASVLYQKPEPNITANNKTTELMNAVLSEQMTIAPCGCNAGCPLPQAPQSWTELLSSGQDINAQDKDGKTILILAIDDVYKFNWLLSKGAKLSIKDNSGNSALDYVMKMPEKKQHLEAITYKGARTPCP